MSWMYYNKETEETCLRGYISELSCFHAVVMAEQTWKIISKTSTKSGSSKTRQKQFFEDLTTLLNDSGGKASGYGTSERLYPAH